MKKSLILTSFFVVFLIASDFEIPIDKAKSVTIDDLKKEIVQQDKNLSKDTLKIETKQQIDDLFSNTVNNSLESPLTKIDNKYKKNNNQMKLKNYVNVTYNKKLEWFSILGYNEMTFEKIKHKYHITPYIENRLLNSISTSKAILYNAFLYDYKYKKPNIAENFYILFPKKILNNRRYSIVDRKLRFVDYLIRTGRPLAVFNYLNKVECMVNIKWMGICMYYLGVAEYFRTGDNKNKYLMIARPYVKKARLLYNMKK